MYTSWHDATQSNLHWTAELKKFKDKGRKRNLLGILPKFPSVRMVPR